MHCFSLFFNIFGLTAKKDFFFGLKGIYHVSRGSMHMHVHATIRTTINYYIRWLGNKPTNLQKKL
jgi:hypothetical protein